MTTLRKRSKPAPSNPVSVPSAADIDHIKDLKPDERNARRHNPRNIGMIETALNEVGAARSIVIDEDGRILAGNGTVEAAAQAGITRVKVVEADGNELVAVRRRGLTARQKQRLALYDNRTSELADWETDIVKQIVAEDAKALEGMFSDVEINDILASDTVPQGDDQGAQVDRAKELQVEWKTEVGQFWRLGEHVLVCGDCTDIAVVDRVTGGRKIDMVFTDPPYGHNNNDGDLIQNWEKALGKPVKSSSGARPIANDGAEANEMVRKVFTIIGERLLKGGCCCCCCGGGGPDPQFARWSLWLDEVIPFKMCVVWDKGGLGMGWHYRRNWECVLVAQQPGAACKWYGGNSTSNLIRDIGKIIPSCDQHPTEKPVELPEWFLRLHSLEGDVVFDPFVGSGTTLIACERLKRQCRAIELDPGFVAMTLQRWSEMTGGKPVLDT